MGAGEPEALTEKFAGAPLHMVWLGGLLLITGKVPTVSVALLLVEVRQVLETVHCYTPASFAVTELMVYVPLVAPEIGMFPLLHWNVGAGFPAQFTEKVTGKPTQPV